VYEKLSCFSNVKEGIPSFTNLVEFNYYQCYNFLMKELFSKEHLIYFMQTGYIRLSKFDLNFITNLHLNIIENKPVTSNQVELVNKLIEKYKRQLLKHNFSKELCNNLPWTCKVIDSDPNHTNVFIYLQDGKIIFKSPFNKRFLKEFRSSNYNPYIWDKTNKYYHSEFSTEALKLLYKSVDKYFSVINYSNDILELLQPLEEYKNKVWKPTLIKNKNNFYVIAINEQLYREIQDISLNDDVSTISELVEYGIEIDSNVICDRKNLLLASKINSSIDYEEIDELIEFLIALKCDCIYFTASFKLEFKEPILEKLNRVTTNHVDLNSILHYQKNKIYNYPVLLQVGLAQSELKIRKYNIKKIVQIRNNMKPK
jgi:hypothetical protein